MQLAAPRLPLPIRAGLLARDYVVTMRPYLLYVSGITGLVGMSLAPELPGPLGVLLGSAFFLSYGFAQAFTDCFHMDTDAISAPYRPLVRGTIPRSMVLRTSLVGLFLCALTAAAFNPWNLLLATLVFAALATYTPMKRRWWGGPPHAAATVGAVFLMGYLGPVGAFGGPTAWSPALGLALGAVLAGYANFVVAGYFKDVTGDRATGYRTLPVAFGLAVSSAVSHALALATLALTSGAVWLLRPPGAPGSTQTLAFLGAGATASLLGQLRLVGVRQDDQAHRAIGPVLHSYVLLLSAVVVAARPSWVVMVTVLYALFGTSLGRRPSERQI